jgi:hypothetical protein
LTLEETVNVHLVEDAHHVHHVVTAALHLHLHEEAVVTILLERMTDATVTMIVIVVTAVTVPAVLRTGN